VFVASDEVQSFSTPNYPDSYPPNQDCYWIIHSEEGKEFDVFLSQGETESENDFVEVRAFLLHPFFCLKHGYSENSRKEISD